MVPFHTDGMALALMGENKVTARPHKTRRYDSVLLVSKTSPKVLLLIQFAVGRNSSVLVCNKGTGGPLSSFAPFLPTVLETLVDGAIRSICRWQFSCSLFTLKGGVLFYALSTSSSTPDCLHHPKTLLLIQFAVGRNSSVLVCNKGTGGPLSSFAPFLPTVLETLVDAAIRSICRLLHIQLQPASLSTASLNASASTSSSLLASAPSILTMTLLSKSFIRRSSSADIFHLRNSFPMVRCSLREWRAESCFDPRVA